MHSSDTATGAGRLPDLIIKYLIKFKSPDMHQLHLPLERPFCLIPCLELPFSAKCNFKVGDHPSRAVSLRMRYIQLPRRV